jgi:hypothetical protein
MQAGDFATVWSAPSAGYYPQLYGVNYVLRVDPANASRVYGEANPAFTYSIFGFHAGDTAGSSMASRYRRWRRRLRMPAPTRSAQVAAVPSVPSGQAYRFIDAPGTLTVTPRSITVTADARSRTYGDANPALTYQVGGSGLVNGDTLSGALATAATAASNVGVYGITQGTLALAELCDILLYRRHLTVTPRAITVTADAKSRAYGDANPALTYQVGGSGSSTAIRCRARWRHRRQLEQCRRLRHRAGHAGGLGQLRAELCERRPDRHPAGDHGDGRCQEPQPMATPIRH